MRFSDTSANLRPSRGRRLGWWTKVVNGLAPHHISGTFRRELRKDPRLPIVLWFQRPPRVGFQSAHRKQVETANLFGDHWIWLVYFWIIDGWDQPWKKTLKNKSQLVNQKIESSYWMWPATTSLSPRTHKDVNHLPSAEDPKIQDNNTYLKRQAGKPQTCLLKLVFEVKLDPPTLH